MYKGQGRIPGGLMNQRPVQGIPSYKRDQQLAMVCPHHELTGAHMSKQRQSLFMFALHSHKEATSPPGNECHIRVVHISEK